LSQGTTETTLQFDEVTGADLSSLSCHPVTSDQAVRELIDPKLGRFAVLGGGTPLVRRAFYGYLLGVGADGYTRELAVAEPTPIAYPTGGSLDTLEPTGNRTLLGSRTYTLELDASTPIADFILQSQQRARPY